MFSFWDQMFGSAKFSHAYLEEYDLQVKTDDSWTTAYLYPAMKSTDNKSELAAGFAKTQVQLKRLF